MADPEPPRESRGLALSGYEAKLVVAALCRYTRASDVHPAHRDSCERLASAVAAASSATLELRPGPTTATAGTDDAVSPAVGGTVDSKVGGARRPGTDEARRPETDEARRLEADEARRPETDEARQLEADEARRPETGRVAPPEPRGTRPEDATEDPFRWGPDRADG